MDPGHPLPAAPDRAADEGTEGRQHACERAAVRRQHDPEAEPHDAEPEVLGPARFLLPRPAHVGQEARAGAGALVERLVVARPVVADRGGVHQDPRSRLGGRDGIDQRPGRPHAALADELLLPRAPAPAPERLARQVDERVALPDGRAHPLPADRGAVDVLGIARDHGRHVTRAGERVAEGGADEARPARHQDSHGARF